MKGWIVVAFAIAALLVLALAVPIEVRHSAPFGFRQALDRERGIAVSGVEIESNYPNFNRIDLDLRAYTEQAEYDLTVVVQPIEEGAAPVRMVHFNRPFDAIRVEKGALGNPFTTVRFDPIADSQGKKYYVWLKVGPRNDDAVVALWSVKTYSQVRGAVVLSSLLAGFKGHASTVTTWLVLGGVMVLFVVASGMMIAILGRDAWTGAWTDSPGSEASR